MEFIKISIKNLFVYRSSVFFSIIGSIIWVFVQITLWSYVYQSNTEELEYMTVYVIFSSLFTLIYSKDMAQLIGGKVSSGNFVYDLLRPTNLIILSYESLLGRLISNIAIKGIPQILIFLPILIRSAPYYNIPYVLCSLIIGHLLYVILYSLIGLLAFLVIEIWPFIRLLDDTIRFLSGAIVPLSLFPRWIQNISSMLPFRYLYFFPLRLLLNEMDGREALSGLINALLWLLISGCILLISYKVAVNKCIVQGG